MATTATVVSVQGEAFARSADGSMRRLASGDSIREGEVVMTSAGAQVSLRSADGQMLVVNAQESFKFGPEASQATAPDAGEAAILAGAAAPAVIAPQPAGALDVEQLLEQEAAAAILAGGGENGGNSFVRLLRITEETTPLAYEFPTAGPGEILPFNGVGGAEITDNVPTPAADVVAVNEDGLKGGKPGGIGDIEYVRAWRIDSMSYRFGDDGPAATDAFRWTGVTLPGGEEIYSGGERVQYEISEDGLTIRAFIEGTGYEEDYRSEQITVFEVVVTDPATGAYEMTLYRPLDHTGADEDDINFVFNYQLTDGNGSTATGSLALMVDDDTPVVSAYASELPTLTLDESPIAGNNSFASAINLDGHFGLAANPDIQNSLSQPNVSIHGSGDNAFDFYSFTVTQAGSTAVFDIDYAMPGFDSTLRLYNSSGMQLAYQDDGYAGDSGSVHGYDSYLTYTFAEAGTYYVQVGRWPSSGIPEGAPYQLQISLNNAITGDSGNVVSDSTGSGDGIWTTSANFSGNFDYAFGADGPADSSSVSYALSLNGDDMGSGLYAVDAEAENGQGDEILLYQNGNSIEGRLGGSAGTLYFSISVNSETGVVTFTRYENVWHGDREDHDDAEMIDAAPGTIMLTATATDFDTDYDDASIDLSSGVFQIEDDGPVAALSPELEVEPLVVDESPVDDTETEEIEGDGIRSATADFTGYFAAPAFGADGPGSVSYAVVLTGEVVGSGLYAVDAGAEGGRGDEILLYQEGEVVEGRVGDQVYFTISVDNDPESDTFGQVTFAQNVEEGVSVWHGYTEDHDDVESLVVAGGGDVANSLQLVQTVIDADGDEARAALDLGEGVFQIEDDGPTAMNVVQGIVTPVLEVAISGFQAGFVNAIGEPGAIFSYQDTDSDPYKDTVAWGDTSGRSSYAFADNPELQGTSGNLLGSTFKLGTFTHNNQIIYTDSLNTVDLVLKFNVIINGFEETIDHHITLNHDETTNTSDPMASRDIITLDHTQLSKTFSVNGQLYTLNIDGFKDAKDGYVTIEFFIIHDNFFRNCLSHSRYRYCEAWTWHEKS